MFLDDEISNASFFLVDQITYHLRDFFSSGFSFRHSCPRKKSFHSEGILFCTVKG